MTNGVLMSIPLDKVFPNPDRPRKEFDQVKLKELAESIKQYGVLEPIVVTPRDNRHMIIAGELRYRASVIASLSEIPAKVIEADDHMSGRTVPHRECAEAGLESHRRGKGL